jgi:hypothetical protein
MAVMFFAEVIRAAPRALKVRKRAPLRRFSLREPTFDTLENGFAREMRSVYETSSPSFDLARMLVRHSSGKSQRGSGCREHGPGALLLARLSLRPPPLGAPLLVSSPLEAGVLPVLVRLRVTGGLCARWSLANFRAPTGLCNEAQGCLITRLPHRVIGLPWEV